jgi:L-alanine-DL-glutamate epimerase-like enolase superfamily enzyme
MRRRLTLAIERFPIAGRFVISRGAKTEAVTIVATIEDQGMRGRGEAVPYARYGESVESVATQIEQVRDAIEQGLEPAGLQALLPPGAARNALDCALWDLAAKRARVPIHELIGLPAPVPVVTAYTISVGTPAAMAAAAKACGRPLLKIKLAGEGDPDRIAAVRGAVPDATLIVDANEAWRPEDLQLYFAACAKAGVELIEQPLPADGDAALAHVRRIVPVCADESVHDRSGLAALRARYDVINVKLDKTGGLSEALALVDEAKAQGFEIFIGCMVASSLAMAPALLLAHTARYVDLDGPLLLARDRVDGLTYDGSIVHPPTTELWG